jgi:hypothetical protein
MLTLLAPIALAGLYAGSSGATPAAASSPRAVQPSLTAAGRAVLPSRSGTNPQAARATSHAKVAAAPGGPASPTVTLGAASSNTCSVCIDSQQVVVAPGGTVTASTTATAGSGATITSVAFQYSPYGANNWKTFRTVNAAPYSAQFNPGAFGLPDGDYQVQAVATDSRGNTGTSNAVAVVVLGFGDTYLDLAPVGSVVRGTVALRAEPAIFGPANPQGAPTNPDTVIFQTSPSGAGAWTPLATVSQAVDADGNPVNDPKTQLPLYTTPFDTAAKNPDGTRVIPDGRYDIRVLVGPGDTSGGSYAGGVLSSVLVDNTPPTIDLANPGSLLTGVVNLKADAADSGSGVASVRFEISAAGAGSWSTIGVQSSFPYQQSFDTRGFANGSYDLRAVATDAAGNSTTSAVVAGLSISNSVTATNPGNFSITDVVAPATNLTLLGTTAGGETWAVGYTTASQAVVNGTQLPFTVNPGDEQLVLLRYTDATGWQIVDVLRQADGTAAYPLASGDRPGFSVAASGAMAPDGEGWLVLIQQNAAKQTVTAVFRRDPGGHFAYNSTATSTLASSALFTSLSSLFANPPTLTVGEDGANGVYGMLVNPHQRIVGSGQTQTGVQYGALSGGTWSVASAPVPAAYQTPGDTVTLAAASETGAGAGWALLKVAGTATPVPPILESFSGSNWTPVSSTGLDALDLTGNFAGAGSLPVTPTAIAAFGNDVWIGATLATGATNTPVVALFDPATNHVVASWCGLLVFQKSVGCGSVLDANHPAAVPAAEFDTPSGPVALAAANGSVDVYAHGTWTAVAASGFDQRSGGGQSLFTGPTSGWLTGPNSLGLIRAQAPPSPLAPWPQANENTLVSVALPPGGAGIGTSGALAVGLGGAALHYDATAGWLVDPVPARARSANLLGVAFDGPSRAVAVGAFGTILDWNGSSWSQDPQSTSLTVSQLNAVAFASDGQGWAVGTFGTILHHDGNSWSTEQVDAADNGADITSVTVAGSQVFAVAGGNLITRAPDGSWERADLSQLSPSVPGGALTLVSGLSDGGVVAAGKSVMIVRQSSGSRFRYSDQPIDGIAVALAAFRDPGVVRAFVSVAPPVEDAAGNPTRNVGGFPAGDGELLLDTGASWTDLSQAQYPGTQLNAEGVPDPNPVLAVAATPDGSAAWAVGGYAGTVTGARAGFNEPLQARPAGTQTASIWRYDAGGSAVAPTLTEAQVTIPAQPGTVSFAFFSGMECNVQCAGVQDAQPDVNLAGAAAEMSAFAAQPGGPSFAMLGGNAVGPSNTQAYNAGNGAADLAGLHNYLSGLGGVPLYAAYGPLDGVPTSADAAQPWGAVFAQAPAAFGLGAAPAGITPVSSGGADSGVNHYYSFDVAQNGGRLRVIALDNSAGSLAQTAPGQTAWLDGQLAAAHAGGVPVVVVCALPLDSNITGAASDADAVAAKLAAAGVLAVFTTSPSQSDVKEAIPFSLNPNPAGPQIPEYEGASLGYQQPQNDGVLWYEVSIDTNAQKVIVQGIPVIQSLALEPLSGLSVARSSTLSFRAVGRRPIGTVPTFYHYASIPAPSCSGCVPPSYSFTSSNPAIGDFVAPSGPGSQFPALNASGHPIHSSTSGLFCGYNAGTTTVSVTSGLLTSSQTVTVQAGPIGQPCGTVSYPAGQAVTSVATKSIQSSRAPAGAAVPPPTPASKVTSPAPVIKLSVPPPPPAPAAVPPAPVAKPAVVPKRPPHAPVVPVPFVPAPSTPLQPTSLVNPPLLVPLLTPPVTPVPPGGATVSSTATARREEKARKHAQQSAFVIRPAGTPATDWFYPAVGVAGVLAVLLAAEGMRPRRRPRYALLEAYSADDPQAGPRPRRRRP